MNKLSVSFIMGFFLSWVLPHLAMEKISTQSNITRYEIPHSTYTIAALPNNEIFAFNGTSYSFLNVGKDNIEIMATKNLDIELCADICVHPEKNIIGMFGKKGICIFSNYELPPKIFQKNYDSNFLFSAQEPVFFVAANRSLVSCNYESPLPEIDVLVKDWGTATWPNYIFSCPTQKRPYFLYTDVARNKICKVIKKDFCWSAHALLDIKHFLKHDKCAYSPLGYICAITNQDKSLYIINTETLQQWVWSKDFRVKDILFLANNRILSVLSENQNTIHFIDSKNWNELFHIDVPSSPYYSSQPKIFSFCDSRRVIIFDDNIAYPDHKSRLLVINLPFFISNIDEHEQYPILRLIDCFSILPQELKKLIATYLLVLSKSE